MTRRLYYDNSYLTEFEASISDCFETEGKTALVLDQTAFYPTSGGQPSDAGWLGGVQIQGVEEDESGRILHFLDSRPAGETVRCRVDWARRFDHMQQHTGQHILSQAFLQTARAATLSFHLGRQTSTIDIALEHAGMEVMQAAEDISAKVIFEDRPVRVLNVTREDLKALGVRKESRREGEIRVIDIEDFDRSPCGGTHVRRCGEVGMIFVLGSERYKGGTRVEFACGGRALQAFRKDHDTLRELGRQFSSHPHDLPALIGKHQQEHAGLLREKKSLEIQLIELEAQDLMRNADKVHGILVVRRHYSDRRADSLKVLAQKITAASRAVAILDSAQEPAQLVVARSQGVLGDCGAAVKQLTARLGGKGGGRPEQAQAGGMAPTALEEWSLGILESLRNGWPE